MKKHRLVLMLLSGLLVQANPLMAESVQDKFNENMNDTSSTSQSWGNAAQNAEHESVWTWFGMGYELRNRGAVNSSNQSGPTGAGNVSGDTRQGKGKQGGRGR